MSFKTPSIIKSVSLPKIIGNNQHVTKAIIAVDGGYSSFKGMGGNTMFAIPSIIKPLIGKPDVVGTLDDTALIMRDNTTGTYYAVGDYAQSLFTHKDIRSLTDEHLYDRYHYETIEFKTLMAASIIIGLSDTPNAEIYIQTGLPSEYLARDTETLINSIARHYDYSLQIGNNAPKSYEFDIPRDHVFVMEQPKGALCSQLYDDRGVLIPANTRFLQENTLIVDGGFGTEDVFAIMGKQSTGHYSYTDTSMKSVFESVLQEVNPMLPEAKKVFELQKFLTANQITYYDRTSNSTKAIDISDIISKHNERLFNVSVARLMKTFDYLEDYQNLIITGGTGESRFDLYADYFKNHPINLYKGSDTMPFMFSIVRGYYMYLLNKLR